MNPSLMITDPTRRPTLTPQQCWNGLRVDGDLWGQKALMVTAMFSYYHGWCRNAYLHYVWSVWLVATLVPSTSWSFPIACIALVWRTREKGTEFFCTKRRTKKIKFLSFCFFSLGPLIAYCNRSHPHSRNNQQSSHSHHSHHIRSLAVHNHSPGCIPGSSSCCSLDSSSGSGLEITSRKLLSEVSRNKFRPWLKSRVFWSAHRFRAYLHVLAHVHRIHGHRTAAAGRPLWAARF